MCRTAPHTRQTEHCETPLTAQAFERHGQKTAAHRAIDSMITVRRDQVARISPRSSGPCPGCGVNGEHGRRFRFTTCKSAKKESRPCPFEYQPLTASAPKSTRCSPTAESSRKSWKNSPASAPDY
jgi:hypothetical protein